MFWWPAWQKLFWKSLSLGGDLICTEWLGVIPSVSRERGGSCQSVSGHTPPPLWHQPIFMQCLRVVHQILLVYSTHIWATVLKPLVRSLSLLVSFAEGLTDMIWVTDRWIRGSWCPNPPCLSYQESNGLLTIWHWESGCLSSQEKTKFF